MKIHGPKINGIIVFLYGSINTSRSSRIKKESQVAIIDKAISVVIINNCFFILGIAISFEIMFSIYFDLLNMIEFDPGGG